MLSPELLKKVENLFIRSRRRVTDVFVGEYESAFRGRGIEFEEFREYVPGDDIRQIDWNVSARMDKPFVKVFREEREQTLFLLVDVSASQNFGRTRMKREVVTEIAALMAYAALRSNDKIGLVIFSDHIERFIPPKKGRAHVWQIIAMLLSHQSKGKGTSIKQAVQFFLSVAHRKTTCILLSDFFDNAFDQSLKIASVRHDFVVLRVLDHMEKVLPKGVLMDFEDLEGKNSGVFDLGSTRLRQKYAEERDLYHGRLNRLFRENDIDFLDLFVDQDHVEVMQRFFLMREKKR